MKKQLTIRVYFLLFVSIRVYLRVSGPLLFPEPFVSAPEGKKIEAAFRTQGVHFSGGRNQKRQGGVQRQGLTPADSTEEGKAKLKVGLGTMGFDPLRKERNLERKCD